MQDHLLIDLRLAGRPHLSPPGFDGVEGLGQDGRHQIIIEAIINLARGLGLAITAEGIETKEQLEYLRDKGVDSMQGYYFARPMPLAELLKFLPDRHQSAGRVF